MLSENDVRTLIRENSQVNVGRSVPELIENGEIPELKNCKIHEGKVTTSVTGDKLITSKGVPIRLMYRNLKISTHDRNRGEIPFKDQVLAINHDLMRGIVRPYIGTSQFDIEGLEPTSTVIAAEDLELLQLENVMRQYMAVTSTNTSLYKAWERAKNKGFKTFKYAGQEFRTASLSPNCKLERLLFSPSTKEAVDRTLDPEELIKMGIISQGQWDRLKGESQAGFNAVQEYLKSRDLVLVDTKTEHGKTKDGRILSADELYTMDSSRYWKLDSLTGRIAIDDKGNPISFSKEFARDLVKNPNTHMYSPEQQVEIAVRYIQGLQHLTGEEFKPDLRPRDERIILSTKQILEHLL